MCERVRGASDQTGATRTLQQAPALLGRGADVPAQRDVLLKIWRQLQGQSPLLWGDPLASYCSWAGVTCCADVPALLSMPCLSGNSVAMLDLAGAGFNLLGTLPASLGVLADLQLLVLSNNTGLHGVLPESLMATQLTYLFAVNTSLCNAPPCSGSNQQSLPGFVDFGRGAVRVGSGQRLQVTWQSGSSRYTARCAKAALTDNKLIVVAIVVACFVGLGLLGCGITSVWTKHALAVHVKKLGRSTAKSRFAPGAMPGEPLGEITLVHTDVEGSTALWEWDHRCMAQALNAHDNILRGLLRQYCGYEVTTEGDSFTLAFHDAVDAVCWCLHAQQGLLRARWPVKLALHPAAATVCISDLKPAAQGDQRGQVLFHGLRVRMAVHTGVPAKTKVHKMTNTTEYQGEVVRALELMADLPAGGQVLLSTVTYQRIYGRLGELRLPALQTAYQLMPSAGDWHPAKAKAGGYLHPATWWPHLKVGGMFRHRATSLADAGSTEASGLAAGLVAMKTPSSGGPPTAASLPEADMAGKDEYDMRELHQDTTTPLLVDMGVHKLGGRQQRTDIWGRRRQPELLMQVLPRPLAIRAVLFPRLPTIQVSPGFLDAPGTATALLPDSLKDGDSVVTLAFCAIDRYKDMVAHNAGAAEVALASFCATVRTTLFVSKGYESQEKAGIFMTCFTSPGEALEWALTLQLALLRVSWPVELAGLACFQRVAGQDGALLFSGPRCKVSIFQGPMSKIVPHTTTGRADYFGLAVNRAARFLCAAVGGQVVAEAGLMEQVLRHWQRSDATTRPLGEATSQATPPALYTPSPDMSVPKPHHHVAPGSICVSIAPGDQANMGACQPGESSGHGFTSERHGAGDTAKPRDVSEPRQSLAGNAGEQEREDLVADSLLDATQPELMDELHSIQVTPPLPKNVASPSLVDTPQATRRQDSRLPGFVSHMPQHQSVPAAKAVHTDDAGLPVSASAATAGRSHFPRRLVDVDVYSIGLFKFKGVTGVYSVVQVLPALLAGRIAFISAPPPSGKAICLAHDVCKVGSAAVDIPDFEQPQLYTCRNPHSTSQTPSTSFSHAAHDQARQARWTSVELEGQ
ncbi:hypothetical protein WJX72_001645 [[Myrmecia] bisecta]|uniref:Guanylate cyclase domain-containing protein n=1 Tax=[Myrmecia] bisecta TaxID=41462 RepID=A0AAW1PP16_9CHLO